MANLNLIFQTLPEPIKNWLVSDNIQNALNEIGGKYNFDLTQDLILSQLFLRLITQDLAPQNLNNELKRELAISDELAAEITKIIDEKILAPISDDLLVVGLDRKMLYYSSADSAGSLQASSGQVPSTSPTRSLRDREASSRTALQSEARPEETKGQAPQDRSAMKPFILHEEKEMKSAAEMAEVRPSFVFKTPPAPAALPQPSQTWPQPTKVTIERVVHYNNFYTPLNHAPLRYHQKIKVPKSKWFV